MSAASVPADYRKRVRFVLQRFCFVWKDFRECGGGARRGGGSSFSTIKRLGQATWARCRLLKFTALEVDVARDHHRFGELQINVIYSLAQATKYLCM